MSQTAKLFTNGRSQAVRLPAAYRFPGDEVFIRKDDVTGDVILSSRPPDGADNLEKFFRFDQVRENAGGFFERCRAPPAGDKPGSVRGLG